MHERGGCSVCIVLPSVDSRRRGELYVEVYLDRPRVVGRGRGVAWGILRFDLKRRSCGDAHMRHVTVARRARRETTRARTERARRLVDVYGDVLPSLLLNVKSRRSLECD